jgi:hypothetical protein
MLASGYARRYYLKVRGAAVSGLRTIMKRLGAIGLLAAFGVGAHGCSENNSSLFIRGALAIEETGCVARAEPGALMRGGGVLDVSFRQDYTAALLVGNQLSTQGDRDSLRTETARVTLTGAEVRLYDLENNQLDEYTVQASGFVDAAPTADSPGFGSVFVSVIRPESNFRTVGCEALDTPGQGCDIIVNVRVFGETLGQREVESNELQFPLHVCYGCLVAFPLVALDPVNNTCQGSDQDEVEATYCFLGQDASIDCRLCPRNSACQSPLPSAGE